jgi:cellobiose PTS system EIIC component
MSSVFDSKAMKGLQKFGEKIGSNKAIQAVQAGMMSVLCLLLVGAVSQIITSIATALKWTTTDSAFYNFFMVPYNMTTGILSIFIVFMIAYNYARALEMKPVMNGIISLAIFLLVAAPVTTVVLQDGNSTFKGLNITYLGAAGLFTAIIVALVSVRINYFCEKKNIRIRMPEVVPQFLVDTFSALIPLLINVFIWHGINTIISKATGKILPEAITNLLAAPLSTINSVPGMMFLALFACLLWTFGIHGTNVILIVATAILIQDLSANAAAVAAGGEAVFYPSFLLSAMAVAGGTGNTLGLVIHGFRCKSEQIKAISKVSIIPGLFGVNEPVAFGMPIMYNPILAIPYILTPLITIVLVWIGYSIDFFQPPYVLIVSMMPIGVGEFLRTMAWQNVLIPVVGIVTGLILYYPFVKIYDKQLVEKEAAAKAHGQ